MKSGAFVCSPFRFAVKYSRLKWMFCKVLFKKGGLVVLVLFIVPGLCQTALRCERKALKFKKSDLENGSFYCRV